jgi:hypothetical protein
MKPGLLNLPTLLPGDCLLYRPKDFFGWVTMVKTWARVAHVEVYAGGGMSVASRNGIGVNAYPLRRAQLGFVLRPIATLNEKQAWAYFKLVQGQGYDWKGLLCFTMAVKQGATDKQFCSEFATNYYRAGGLKPFAPDWSADEVSPAQFLQSAAFVPVWTDQTAFGTKLRLESIKS